MPTGRILTSSSGMHPELYAGDCFRRMHATAWDASLTGSQASARQPPRVESSAVCPVSPGEALTLWLYVLVSAAGGLLVGVLGTGSSLIILPSLSLIFAGTMPEHDPIRLAAGTTMASIAVGAIAGAIAQHRRRNLDPRLFQMMVVPYMIGAISGPWAGRLLPTAALEGYVALLVAIVAARMLWTNGAPAQADRDYRSHRFELTLVFLAIGFFCSLAGIASGIFAIPYLSRFALPIRSIVGTSTASAAVFATVGALGYVSAGWSVADRPEASLGFVYLPAFVVLAATSAVATPLGVRFAGKFSERALRRSFAAFLFVAAIAIIYF
jgi:uncharacterized protein